MHRCCCQGAVTEADKGKPPHIRTGIEAERSQLCVRACTVYTGAFVKKRRSLIVHSVMNAFAWAVCPLAAGFGAVMWHIG